MSSDALKENHETEDLATNLADLTKELQDDQKKWMSEQGTANLDPLDNRIHILFNKCAELAHELLDCLQKLKVEDDAKFRMVKSAYRGFLSVWNKPQIKALAKRLEKHQQEIDTRILVGLRKKAEKLPIEMARQFKALDVQSRDTLAQILLGNQMLYSLKDDTVHIKGQQNHIVGQNSHILAILSGRRRPASVFVGGQTTALHRAAEAGIAQEVQQLLRLDINDIDSTDEHGCTPLHLASTHEVATRLLKKSRRAKHKEDIGGRTPLHCAVLKRRLGTIKTLLEAETNVTLLDNTGKTAAFYARSCPAAMWLLKYGPEPNARNKDFSNASALQLMAWLRDLEGVKFFLDQGTDPNWTDDRHRNALCAAASAGDALIVESLLDGGALARLPPSGTGWSPLRVAVENRKTEVVEILLSRGTPATEEPGLNGNTILLDACGADSDRIAHLLIDAGANIHATNDAKQSALMLAARIGHVRLVDELLERGAKPDTLDSAGTDCLYHAIKGGHAMVLTSLLRYDVRTKYRYADSVAPNAVPKSSTASDPGSKAVPSKGAGNGTFGRNEPAGGTTSVNMAARLGHHEFVKQLLARGFQFGDGGPEGKIITTLAIASYHGREKVVELLLDRKARYDIGAKYGYPAISAAASNGKDGIVRLLHARGADVDQRGPDGSSRFTAVMRAAMFGFPSTIRTLSELGADLDLQDNLGQTALHHAILKGHMACVVALLDEDANVDIQDSRSGWTPLMLAISKDQPMVVNMLIQSNTNLQLLDNVWRTAWALASHAMLSGPQMTILSQLTQYEHEALCRFQAKQHHSEIAAHMLQIYTCTQSPGERREGSSAS